MTTGNITRYNARLPQVALTYEVVPFRLRILPILARQISASFP